MVVAKLAALFFIFKLLAMAILPVLSLILLSGLVVWFMVRYNLFTHVRLDRFIAYIFLFIAFVTFCVTVFCLALLIPPLFNSFRMSFKWNFQHRFCPAPTDACTVIPEGQVMWRGGVWDDVYAVMNWMVSVPTRRRNMASRVNYCPGFDGGDECHSAFRPAPVPGLIGESSAETPTKVKAITNEDTSRQQETPDHSPPRVSNNLSPIFQLRDTCHSSWSPSYSAGYGTPPSRRTPYFARIVRRLRNHILAQLSPSNTPLSTRPARIGPTDPPRNVTLPPLTSCTGSPSTLHSSPTNSTSSSTISSPTSSSSSSTISSPTSSSSSSTTTLPPPPPPTQLKPASSTPTPTTTPRSHPPRGPVPADLRAMKRYIVTTPDVPHRSRRAHDDHRRPDGPILNPWFWITTIFWAVVALALASLKTAFWALVVLLVWMGVSEKVRRVRVPWEGLAVAAGLALRVLVGAAEGVGRAGLRVWGMVWRD